MAPQAPASVPTRSNGQSHAKKRDDELGLVATGLGTTGPGTTAVAARAFEGGSAFECSTGGGAGFERGPATGGTTRALATRTDGEAR